MVSCLITDVLLKTLCKFHLECDEIQSFLPHQQPLHLSSALGTSNNYPKFNAKISSSILKISSPSLKKRSPKKHGLKKHHQNIQIPLHGFTPSSVPTTRPRKWHRIHQKSTLTSLSARMPRKFGGKGNKRKA